MSGTGLKFKITNVIEHLEEEKSEFGEMSEETEKIYHWTITQLKLCEISSNRLDYLFDGDDSEETFKERWKEEMEKLLNG